MRKHWEMVARSGAVLDYVFVLNGPQDFYDILGLKAGCPSCGKDVTRKLGHAQMDVQTRFGALSSSKKWANCKPWIAPTVLVLAQPLLRDRAINDWDMDNLTHQWMPKMTSPSCAPVTVPFDDEDLNPCFETVWVESGCYNAWDVNYLLFGWLSKLCHDAFPAMSGSKSSMTAKIWPYKIAGAKWGQAFQATAWAKRGYDGYPLTTGSTVISPPSPPWRYRSCKECGECATDGLASEWPHASW